MSRARLTVVEPALFEWDLFEMAALIQSPAKCEVRSVIWILYAKGERPAEIKKTNCCCLWGNVMNRQNVTKWCRELCEGRADVHDGQRSGRPSLMTWFKGQAADFYDSGYRSWFRDLINVWTMPATVLKNKAMYRQFIHCVAFVN
jgi:hypothetical protein